MRETLVTGCAIHILRAKDTMTWLICLPMQLYAPRIKALVCEDDNKLAYPPTERGNAIPAQINGPAFVARVQRMSYRGHVEKHTRSRHQFDHVATTIYPYIEDVDRVEGRRTVGKKTKN